MARHVSSRPPAEHLRSSLVGRPSILGIRIPTQAQSLLLALHLPALWVAVTIEGVLLLVALVPQSIWASYGFPNGPIPHSLSAAGLYP